MIGPELEAELCAGSSGSILRDAAGLNHGQCLRQPRSGLKCPDGVVGHAMASQSNGLAMLGEPAFFRIAPLAYVRRSPGGGGLAEDR